MSYQWESLFYSLGFVQMMWLKNSLCAKGCMTQYRLRIGIGNYKFGQYRWKVNTEHRYQKVDINESLTQSYCFSELQGGRSQSRQVREGYIHHVETLMPMVNLIYVCKFWREHAHFYTGTRTGMEPANLWSFHNRRANHSASRPRSQIDSFNLHLPALSSVADSYTIT